MKENISKVIKLTIKMKIITVKESVKVSRDKISTKMASRFSMGKVTK